MSVTFLASFPAIQSAIKIGQDGARIQLDIPETEMGNAVELLAMRNTVLKVTIEVLQNRDEQRQRGQKVPTRSKWQPSRAATQEPGAN